MGVSDNNKRIAKNTIFLYFRLLVVMAVQLYTTRIILKMLGVVDYGLYGVIGGLVIIFTTLNSTFASATSRYITVELGKEDRVQLRIVFSTSLVIHTVLAVIILVLCETVGLWFLLCKMVIPADRFFAAQWVYQFSVLTCLFSVVQIPFNALIIAHEKMNVYAYVGLFEAFTNLFIAFLIQIAPTDKLVFYALCKMLLQICVSLFYRIYCRGHYKESRFIFHKEWKLYKEMLSYSAYDMIGVTSVMAQGQGLNIILNLFCGPAVNAARSVSYQIQGAISQFASNFMTAVNPQIVKYYVRGEIDNMMKLVKRSSILSFLLLFVMILPLSLEIRFVLQLWLGAYPEYAPAFAVLVLISALISAFRNPRTRIFHATGHIKLSNLVTGTTLCLALPLGYVLMKMGLPPTSVFWGVILTMCIADCTNLVILKRYITYSMRDFVLQVHLRCVVTAIFASVIPLILYFYMVDNFLRFICIVLASIFTTTVFAWMFALSRSERILLIAFIREKKWKRR